MTFKVGDILTIDGETMEVTGENPPHFWLKALGTFSYFYMALKTQDELDDLFKQGRLISGRIDFTKGGNNNHFHSWKRYRGLNKVLDICDCGAEIPVDWRIVGDTKRKT